MCLTKDEMVSKIEQGSPGGGAPTTVRIVGGSHAVNIQTSLKRSVPEFVAVLTTRYNFPIESFKSICVSCAAGSPVTFDNKVVDFTGPTAESSTIEDLMGVVIPESNAPTSEPQYIFKLDHNGKGAESNGLATNQDEEGACHEENQLDPSVSNPVSFVGLVNQAMTCYLNSLIQALFMTPEFRNAVYRWKYEGAEDKTITYQLQKLFVNLQTSSRTAVETTDLTRSFGWESSDAWQQHDIQELCRVLFDALETQFKESKTATGQADLINNLYQGKMRDYVKCLECGTEKSREDSFLDIPLPVRPFGSNVAYADVMEAMRAFVRPETLDGANQYHCDKCGKKCDAHKGLKFTEFPYLLTLHLMRFDFDYSTMHRIKLNDKVKFPRVLNLNSFYAAEPVFEKEKEEESEGFPEEIPIKCDDSSTTDSGSALDDESCQDQDVDEGIDISHPEPSSSSSSATKDPALSARGPYVYELFSIMIHSGSASGGHYYAYIKNFSTNEWYCFNDQSVTRITDEDIHKSYGGGPARGYYSGVYSSSTNAYMLMYRQIDKERNVQAISKDEFPQHIKELHERLQKEEADKVNNRGAGALRVQVYAKKTTSDNSNSSEGDKVKIFLARDATVRELQEQAFEMLNMKEVTALDQCRLVKVDNYRNTFEPLENPDELVEEILEGGSKLKSRRMPFDMLLEYKQPGEEFQTYVPGCTRVNMFQIDVESGCVSGPTELKTNVKSSVKELKSQILNEHNLAMNTPLYIALDIPRSNPVYLRDETAQLKHEFDCSKIDYFCGTSAPRKIYVCFNKMDHDPEVEFEKSAMFSIIQRIANTIRLTVQLPDVDPDTLSKYRITSLKKYTNVTSESSSSDPPPPSSSEEVTSPSPSLLPLLLNSQDVNQSDQSTSEDSSLTDSERTLMGDDPDESRDDLIPSEGHIQELDLDNTNMTFSLSSGTTSGKPDVPSICLTSSSSSTPSRHYEDEDEQEKMERALRTTLYKHFKVLDANFNANITIDRPQLMIEIDKRTTTAYLMKHLEPYVRVPSSNFCICTYDQHEIEHKLTNTMENLTDGEVITVKLKRILQEGECQMKVYRMIEDKDPQFLLEMIISKGQSIGDIKAEVVEEVNKKLSSDLQVERCRLREKSWKKAGKIHLSPQIIGREVIVFNPWEVFLQEINGSEIKTDDNQTVLSTRRYNPDQNTLDNIEEIVIEDITLASMKAEISKHSGIPVEFVDTILIRETSFTVTSEILSDLHRQAWNTEPPDYLIDGKLVVYCDNRVERKSRESSHDDTKSSDSKPSYLTRKKEKALKIVTQRGDTVTPQPD
uniref:Ubiquitin carboxyl-terminal hydrolase 47 n=1 Tax=Cacopsylla melanoneura TaxID=428564 RepID=A0A8D8T3H7_9HEMI